MFSKFIQVSAVACALALGGTAVANNNGGTQSQGTQQPQPQQPQQSQTQQQQPQQGQMQQPQQGQMQQGQQGQQGQTTQQQNNLKSFRLTSLGQDQIKEVQTRLKEVGFYRGQVDGVLGTNTRSALVSYFQQQASLVQQGRISDQALSGFGFGTNDIERVRGVDTGNNNNAGNTNNNNNTDNNVNNDRQSTRGQQ